MRIRVMLMVLCLSVFAECASAQTYTYSTLATNGVYGGLAIHNDVLYGYASGGTHNGGLMFSLTSGGKQTTLYNFGATSTDGKSPIGAPNYQSSTGNWYGITTAGGRPGHGTIFKLTSKNKESTVYSWSPYSQATFANEPSMTMDSAGNLYGYASESSHIGASKLFQVSPKGVYTVVAQADSSSEYFNGGPTLRGTTLYGTATGGIQTLFSTSTSGGFSTIYTFVQGLPLSKLTQDAAGVLYGTSISVGGSGGSVFSFDPLTGVFTTLSANGGLGPVVLDRSGKVYWIFNSSDGLTNEVHDVVPSTGVETTLYAFPSGTNPGYQLVMDGGGSLYGNVCTANGCSVFKLTKN